MKTKNPYIIVRISQKKNGKSFQDKRRWISKIWATQIKINIVSISCYDNSLREEKILKKKKNKNKKPWAYNYIGNLTKIAFFKSLYNRQNLTKKMQKSGQEKMTLFVSSI